VQNERGAVTGGARDATVLERGCCCGEEGKRGGRRRQIAIGFEWFLSRRKLNGFEMG
jgi:hypothetical protein